jgi:hypothetical protein
MTAPIPSLCGPRTCMPAAMHSSRFPMRIYAYAGSTGGWPVAGGLWVVAGGWAHTLLAAGPHCRRTLHYPTHEGRPLLHCAARAAKPREVVSCVECVGCGGGGTRGPVPTARLPWRVARRAPTLGAALAGVCMCMLNACVCVCILCMRVYVRVYVRVCACARVRACVRMNV